MAQFGSWSFFPCIHVTVSVGQCVMNVCWLVGQMDEWLVIHSNVPNAALYIWNLFVHQVNIYIYTRTYYIVANAFANFCIHIEIYDNTLSSWARPTEEHHHHHRHHWFTVFAVLWIVLVSLLKTNWNELVGWLVLLNRCGCG